jgi:hypothetical protein
MNRIDRFLAKSKSVEIDGETFVVKALSIKEIDLVSDLDDPDKKTLAVGRIIKKILKDNFPEATEEQFDNFALVNIELLMNAFAEVNNLETGKLNEALKERMAKLKQ